MADVTLLNPLALGLAALSIPIVLMYMLKLRRQEKVVSSTFLWRRAVDDVQANAPWQRLRPSLLLVVQLLALVALVLAIGQPAYSRARTYAGDLVLIVDQSYGMQARDVLPSRFVVAQREAKSLASERGSGSVVSVIGMGPQPTMALAESDDGSAIDSRIDGLRPGVSAPNLLGALTLAASLARSGTPIHAVLLTSRQSGITSAPMTLPFPLQVVRVGGRLTDLGITAFSSVQSRGVTRALVRVSNFGDSKESSTVQLTVDGTLADVRPITLGPGKQENLFWNGLPARSRVLHAQLSGHDDVDMDKSAWAVGSTQATRRVLIVSSRVFFLQAALSVDPSVELDAVAPGRYRSSLAARYDLVVFDRFLPSAMPLTSTLLVAPPHGESGGLTFGGWVGAGTPAPSAGSPSSLLRYVDLSDVHVARARQVSLPGWLSPVIVAGSSTLLAVGEHSDVREAVLAFDLQDSDWPLRVSFPVLMHNLLGYLAPGLALRASNIVAGAPVNFLAPASTRALRIEVPSGAEDTLTAPFPPYTSTAEPGLYHVRIPGGPNTASLPFAVNFFPSRPAPAVGRSTVWLGSSAKAVQHAVSVPVSVAWACGWLVLVVLSAEWWLAYKR